MSSIAATSSPRSSSAYGLRALATVVFDIDSGQRLDALYPPACTLSDDAKQSIAHLALPHSNNQDEGDTQFTVRFREAADSDTFLFGFVLFRQQRDETRSRGYFQKALVLVSERPFIDLYDRVLRVTGPLFFTAGSNVLQAIYDGIHAWPAPKFGVLAVLPLVGTYITCVVPQLIDYSDLDAAFAVESASAPSSPTADHFIVESDEQSPSDDDENDDQADDLSSACDAALTQASSSTDATNASTDSNSNRTALAPSPSFGDLLIAKQLRPVSAFESVGLYSSFVGLESSLWLLWQLAITGESVVVLSPHARTCSQATLAFASLIAPLQFAGDYRPYYALYETDFDSLVQRQNASVSRPSDMTIIGSTNPFFLKSLSHWPNALIFPFLEPSKTKMPPAAAAASARTANDASDSSCECVSLRIKPNVLLDAFEPSQHARVLRRCPSLVVPDATVLRQLVSPPEVFVTQTASVEDDPFVTINNAILRKHFNRLTKRFLVPFEQFFGIWRSNGMRPHVYMSVADCLKPFDLQTLLTSIDPRKLPRQIRATKWKALYTGFVASPHFAPWFAYRRARCVHHFASTMRLMRAGITPTTLLQSACGIALSVDQCRQLRREVKAALATEQALDPVDDVQVRVIEAHLRAVRKRLKIAKAKRGGK